MWTRVTIGVRRDSAATERWPHVADVDCLGTLSAGCRKVGEGVRRCRLDGRLGSAIGSAKISTPSETPTKASAAHETASGTKAPTAAAVSATKATARAAETYARASKAVFANFERTTLPFVTVELRDGVSSIFGALKCHNAGAFRAAVVT